MSHTKMSNAKSISADFVHDIWYFAGISTDFPTGDLKRKVIAGEPMTFGRKQNGDVFALRDICPHRAAPFSAGKMVEDTVECPYHGWRFGVDDGACKEIPALCADNDFESGRIKVRTFPVREDGPLIWVYLSKDKRFTGPAPIDPPQFSFANRKPMHDDELILNCHVDHAVIGLIDPAHGPYVHRQWWWRSGKSMHEKAKAFEPCDRGFVMAAHSPSSNSVAYRALGGKPITEITFQIPGIRTERITVGGKTLLSFTAVTPSDESHTVVRQLLFTDITIVKMLAPIIRRAGRKFLRQDQNMVDLQQKGLCGQGAGPPHQRLAAVRGKNLAVFLFGF